MRTSVSVRTRRRRSGRRAARPHRLIEASATRCLNRACSNSGQALTSHAGTKLTILSVNHARRAADLPSPACGRGEDCRGQVFSDTLKGNWKVCSLSKSLEVSGRPLPGPPAVSASYCSIQRRTALSTRSRSLHTCDTLRPWSRIILTTATWSSHRSFVALYSGSSVLVPRRGGFSPINVSEIIGPQHNIIDSTHTSYP